jgi:hypothetical protein
LTGYPGVTSSALGIIDVCGEVGLEDRQEHEFPLHGGFRLLSVYRSSAGEKFWIITEADRSATTVLMPEDY